MPPLGRLDTGLAYGRVWHLVDARDKLLGRLAQRISIALRGKYKPIYHPSVDCGDYVVVINARDVTLTGKKPEKKMYYSHSGWPGGLKVQSFNEVIDRHPAGPLKKAVWGSMPKNILRKIQYERLFVFAGSEHPFEANIMSNYEEEAAAKAKELAAEQAAASGTAPPPSNPQSKNQ
ncbi:ribosomal protein L13 domain-containing protein [Zopfochytrium polystomum]|nr:ribosomal protein L13 domain-containing protein [Zopfochytrium polystomum]